jgi:hypothetical protein
MEPLDIDEAAHLKECESIIPLVILVGDERQLQAMVENLQQIFFIRLPLKNLLENPGELGRNNGVTAPNHVSDTNCWEVRMSSRKTMTSILQDHKRGRRHIFTKNLKILD